MKSEPAEYSIDDLQRDRRTGWNGVRNYEARNLIRDGMSVNDRVLYYHSSTSSPAVVGVARVASAAYPDHSALDPRSGGYDPKASRDNPRWFMIDLEFESKFPIAVTLERIKAHPQLQELALVRRGRLSVQPVTDREFAVIKKMGQG